MPPRFQAPKGTFDVLPPASARYEQLVARFAAATEAAGFGLLLGPMFEDVGVYERVGDSTDIVRKEMYDFEDKGGRHIALRPDSTPSVVRAFVEHRPTPPWKVWYVGPHFRYDRPQKGRHRQHHQLGAECLGVEDPDLDVEMIELAWSLYASVGLTQVRLLLNSMGDAACRPAYRDALLAHLSAREEQLCEEHRDHYRDNPMRVFDCKREACREATAEAPLISEHLCADCGRHFARVREGLEAAGIPVHLDPRLVRGQDYYTRTTFEFAGLALAAAQNGLGGGGRYDGLVEATGGPPTPGIGFGLGIERILDACDAEGTFAVDAVALDAFVVDLTGGDHARALVRELRRSGLRADRAYDGRALKAQLKAADRSGARVALIVGEDEAAGDYVTLRPLREADGGQRAVKRDELIDELRRRP